MASDEKNLVFIIDQICLPEHVTSNKMFGEYGRHILFSAEKHH